MLRLSGIVGDVRVVKGKNGSPNYCFANIWTGAEGITVQLPESVGKSLESGQQIDDLPVIVYAFADNRPVRVQYKVVTEL